MNKLIASLLLAATVVPVTLASNAHACGMSIRMEQMAPRPTPAIEISSAEKMLNEGQGYAVARKVLASFPSIRSASAGRDPLETRAMRVFALAIVRSNTQVQSGWTRNADLAWAEQAMREIDAKRPNDPAVQADFGEVLAAVPGKTEEAAKLLSSLADSDLMGSPFAYAALARLRSVKGDSEGSALAMRRCETMAGAGRATICRGSDFGSKVAPPAKATTVTGKANGLARS